MSAVLWPAAILPPPPPPPPLLPPHALLDQVDAAAGRSAESCPATAGCLSPIEAPRICLSRAGLQVHDALPQARRALLVSHHASAQSSPPQHNPDLGEYTIAVSYVPLSSDDHLTVTGLRLPPPPLGHALPSLPPAQPWRPRLFLFTQPSTLRPLPSVARGPALPAARRHYTLNAWGVLILWGKEPFLLAVDGSAAHETLLIYTVGCLGAISPLHRDALQHRGLRPANVRRLLCDNMHKHHAVPVLPLANHFPPGREIP